jgi:hypothetical protein
MRKNSSDYEGFMELIPYASEQGINSAHQGINSTEQGTYSASSEYRRGYRWSLNNSASAVSYLELYPFGCLPVGSVHSP